MKKCKCGKEFSVQFLPSLVDATKRMFSNWVCISCGNTQEITKEEYELLEGEQMEKEEPGVMGLIMEISNSIGDALKSFHESLVQLRGHTLENNERIHYLESVVAELVASGLSKEQKEKASEMAIDRGIVPHPNKEDLN
jgi:hypothetical protein|tara:strand:- start:1107 stop:1523 length:417 start_codon:yes stop_codon:yes gene_type:complete